MPYVAIINTPGYLPDMVDEPATFDTAQEAWQYLLDEYAMSWNDVDIPGDPDDPLPPRLATVYRETVAALVARASDKWLVCDFERVGSVYTPTPGRSVDDPHDLGLVYSVEFVADEDVTR